MVLVHETVMADWQAWHRDIRLQALRDAPDAFGSTYAEQNRRGENHWRQRVAGPGGLFLAWIPEVSVAEPAGMVGGYSRRRARQVELISMLSGHRPAAAASAKR